MMDELPHWYKVWSIAVDSVDKIRHPCARIQWKGTDVCMDVICKCGAMYHIDGEFCHFVKCPRCGKTFACAPEIALVEVQNSDADPLPMTLIDDHWDGYIVD